MPSDTATGLPKLGHTWFEGSTPPTSYAQTVHLEGQTAEFRDMATNTAGQAEGVRTGMTKTCAFVRNVSGVTLLKKMAVRWQAAYEGQRVDGYSAAAGAQVAGIVDEYLATGIPNNDLGWIVVAGPVQVLTAVENASVDYAQGTILYAQTAAASTHSTTAGRVLPWVGTFTAAQTTDGTAGKILSNYIGRVMSAKSTNTTNTSMLVNLTNLK